jgi:NAD-dependent SIR2 family protein deacetylase
MSAIDRARKAIDRAEALLIGAGAGMGCDSGLPDFRGREGFWKAYPPYAKLGLGFWDLGNAQLFRTDPALAWGFYGHRLNLYRQTQPHRGFERLLGLADRMEAGYFVYTSNVDGQFQKAGFSGYRIVECHGSIHQMQCTRDCGVGVFPAASYTVTVDENMRAMELPWCPRCGALVRPNILMFYDCNWDYEPSEHTRRIYRHWLQDISRTGRRLVVIECGAGTAIPSVRIACESAGGTLIRINPREAQGADISLAMGTAEALDMLIPGT